MVPSANSGFPIKIRPIFIKNNNLTLIGFHQIMAFVLPRQKRGSFTINGVTGPIISGNRVLGEPEFCVGQNRIDCISHAVDNDAIALSSVCIEPFSSIALYGL